jgi:hypothetical protein
MPEPSLKLELEYMRMVHDMVEAALNSKPRCVRPDDLVPSFLGRRIDKLRLAEVTKKMESGWAAREPAIGVILPRIASGRSKFRVYSGSHRTIAAQELKLQKAYICLLDTSAHKDGFAFVEAHEGLIVRSLQALQPSPEPFGVMAQVRVLAEIFAEHSRRSGSQMRPTWKGVKALFCPSMGDKLTDSDHFIFDTHNGNTYYRGACVLIDSGVLDELIDLECRYGSRNSFSRKTLRDCYQKGNTPDNVREKVLDFIETERERRDEGMEQENGAKRNEFPLRGLRLAVFTSKERGKTKCSEVAHDSLEEKVEEEEEDNESEKEGDGGGSKSSDAEKVKRGDSSMEVEPRNYLLPVSLPPRSLSLRQESPLARPRKELFWVTKILTNRTARYEDAWVKGGICIKEHDSAAKAGFSVDYQGLTLDMSEADCTTILQENLLTDNALNFLASTFITEELLSETQSFWFGDTIISASFLSANSFRDPSHSNSGGSGRMVLSLTRASAWRALRTPGKYRCVLFPFYLKPELFGRRRGETGHWVLGVVKHFNRLFTEADGYGNADKLSSRPVCTVYDSCATTRKRTSNLVQNAVNRILQYVQQIPQEEEEEDGDGIAVSEAAVDTEEQKDGTSCAYFVLRHAAKALESFPKYVVARKSGIGRTRSCSSPALSVEEMKKMGSFQCLVHMETRLAPNLCAWLARQAVDSAADFDEAEISEVGENTYSAGFTVAGGTADASGAGAGRTDVDEQPPAASESADKNPKAEIVARDGFTVRINSMSEAEEQEDDCSSVSIPQGFKHPAVDVESVATTLLRAQSTPDMAGGTETDRALRKKRKPRANGEETSVRISRPRRNRKRPRRLVAGCEEDVAVLS